MRAARREAERASAFVLRSVRRAQAVAAASAVLALAIGVAGVGLGFVPLLLGWPALVLAAAYGWAFMHARRGPSTLEQGVQMHVLVERDLHEHLAKVAAEIGVRCPTEVRLVPESEIWLELDPDRPVLFLGAPLMWHLDRDEFDRLVAGPLSRMRALLDPDVRPGLRLAARLDTRRLMDDTTPLVGSLIRRSGRALETRRRSLMDAINQWGDGSLPRALRPTPTDRAQLLALREVDDLENARRRAATHAGVGIQAPAAAAMATLAGCIQAGVLGTGANRPMPRPASSLLVDATATDRRLGDRTAMIDGQPVPLLEPADTPRRVALPHWREERDAGLPVLVHLTGRWPRTLSELFDVLAPGAVQHSLGVASFDRVPMMGALLTRLPIPPVDAEELSTNRDDEAENGQRLDAVVQLMTAAVQVAAVEQRRLTLWWDDAWGAQLRDKSGEVVPVEAFVGDAVARRNPRALLAWLDEVGIDAKVAWEESGPPPDGLDELPIAAFAAAEAGPRLSGIDVVILDGWLLGYPHPTRKWLQDLTARYRPGESRADELVALARTHRNQLVDVADPAASVRLADVTAAHLDGSTYGPGWSLRLDLPDRRLEFTGRERAAVMGAALEPILGDRLTRTGTARADAPARSWSAWLWRLATQSCLVAALVFAAAVLVGVADTPWLPGAGVMQHALSVLVLGTVPALLCRLAQDRADRNLRRGGALPPVEISTEVDDTADLVPARPVPQPS